MLRRRSSSPITEPNYYQPVIETIALLLNDEHLKRHYWKKTQKTFELFQKTLKNGHIDDLHRLQQLKIIVLHRKSAAILKKLGLKEDKDTYQHASFNLVQQGEMLKKRWSDQRQVFYFLLMVILQPLQRLTPAEFLVHAQKCVMQLKTIFPSNSHSKLGLFDAGKSLDAIIQKMNQQIAIVKLDEKESLLRQEQKMQQSKWLAEISKEIAAESAALEHTDHTGKRCSAPDEALTQSFRKELGLSPTHHEIDYQVFNPTTGAGGAERIGNRETQQDRLITCQMTSSEYSRLSVTDQQSVLPRVFEKMSAIIAHENLQGGATGIAVILNGDDLEYCYVGDPTIHRVIIDGQNSVVASTKLNSTLHTTTEPTEITRLKKFHRLPSYSKATPFLENDQYGDPRLLGILNITRAFGDLPYRTAGLISTPVSHADTLTSVDKNHREFIVIACDGLTELNHIPDHEVGELIAKYLTENPKMHADEIARRLRDEAHKRGVNDNISLLVIPVHANREIGLHAVFDGHGSHDVVVRLNALFEKLVKLEIKLLFAAQQKMQQTAAKSEVEFKSAPKI